MAGISDMTNQMEQIIGWGEPNTSHSWYAARNGSYFGRGSTPWCNMAITWAAYLSGNYEAVCFNTDYAYTVYHARKFQSENQWTYGYSGIRTGDIIFYQWEGGGRSIGKIDHVEYVTRVTDSHVHTIGGNVSNQGLRKVRSKNNLICGYGRPNYTDSPSDGSSSEDRIESDLIDMADLLWYSLDPSESFSPNKDSRYCMPWHNSSYDDVTHSASVMFNDKSYMVTAHINVTNSGSGEGRYLLEFGKVRGDNTSWDAEPDIILTSVSLEAGGWSQIACFDRNYDNERLRLWITPLDDGLTVKNAKLNGWHMDRK